MSFVSTASFLDTETVFTAVSPARVSPRSSAAWNVTSTSDPRTDAGWDRLVASHPSANVFHTSAWANVLAKTYGHRPVYLRCSQFDRLAALVPMMEVRSPLTGVRGVCVPFADFCEPLLFGAADPSRVCDAIAKVARSRRWEYAEIRGDTSEDSSFAGKATFLAHILDLRQGLDACAHAFSSSVRRAIRKAERSDLEVDASSTLESMRDFYQLHARTRRRLGLPPQPFAFFQHIQREIIDRGLGLTVVATRESKPIAGAVFLKLQNRALYKFGASDERAQEFRASNLVIWHGIKRLMESGVDSLHFGRTSPGDEGLRRFKLGWGAREEVLNYHRFRTRSNRWAPAHRGALSLPRAVCSRMPIALNRILGAAIYPHLD
jgi:hypothetical protein